MSFLWPGSLLLLGLLPVMIAAYVWMLRRRRRYAVRFSSLSLVRAALPRRSSVRRHIPFALFLLALASLMLALARPVETVDLPAGQATILLTIDVSRSMLQTDIAPSRIAAAQSAALSFVRRQSPNTQIGIVAFAGYAEMIQAPTNDQSALEMAIRSLTTARRTAIGSGIVKSLEVIAEVDEAVAPLGEDPFGSGQSLPVTGQLYAPAIIVLLTDGVATNGPLPLDAAQLAAERGIRVYTIGFGTENGSEGFGFGDPSRDPGNTPPSGGGWFRRGIDEETLKQIAELTDGEYYTAESADELQQVFEDLPTNLITRQERIEISVAFASAGALLAAVALALSLIWHPLP